MAVKDVKISVGLRSTTGSNKARQMRRLGKVPAVLYGRGTDTVALTVPETEAKKVLGHHGLLTLNFPESQTTRLAVAGDIQIHFLNGSIVHVDFREVKLDEKLVTTVPVEAVGIPAGLASGGTLEVVMHLVPVRCLPLAIPEKLVINVSHLNVGDNVTMSQLTLPEGVEAVYSDPNQVVFHMAMPAKIEEEVKPAEGAEAAAEGAAPAGDAKAAPAAADAKAAPAAKAPAGKDKK